MKEVQVIQSAKNKINRQCMKVVDRLRVAAYCRVSKDSEEQLNSYNSQMKYYKEFVESNPNWLLVDIYADEAISGTQVTKRTDFQRMITDATNGLIDLIITKSISRFARNTLDTLKYVRLLKERNIAVIFEKENINTLTMNGEILLTILSSLAQQESESISANVKMGLKMKMKRGELIGFQGCLGYDYNPNDKTININIEEADTVRYIFQRYVEGAGAYTIAKELTMLGFKTKRGSSTWGESAIRRIIKNEKYKGDILMGKTFTVDPITHRRLENMGEEEKYYIKDHHQPIVSEEMFNEAHRLLEQRSIKLNNKGTADKKSYKYTFSSKIFCFFCGGTFSRRSWHSGYKHEKRVWQCTTATKKGRRNCPDSKGLDEKLIENAFMDSYKLICTNNSEVIEEFMQRLEKHLNETNLERQLRNIDNDIYGYNCKINKLVDMRLNDTIDKDNYEKKHAELAAKIEELQKKRFHFEESFSNEKDLKKRISEFKRVLEVNKGLSSFDRAVFESIIDRVIIGEVDDKGKKNPYCITFIYKTGFKSSIDCSNSMLTKGTDNVSVKDVNPCSFPAHGAR
ncbi:MAG: recombinase family protein [Bacillota bacterium]